MEEEDIDLSYLEIRENEKKRTHSEALPLDLDCDSSEEMREIRRSSRKKIRPMDIIEKRQVNTRPRKLNVNSSVKDIEHYYLDKKVKLSSPALETIFEEPKKDVFMSTRKLKRSIQFSEVISDKPDKNKVKKRTMKAKKIIKGGWKKLGQKLALDMLLNKLKDLDNVEESTK